MSALPPLPTAVFSALGPIAVEVVAELKSKDGEEVMGLWLPEQRIIRICDGMALMVQWQTLFHEQAHAVVWDAGVHLSEKQNEAVADAIGTARVAEMIGMAPHP